MECNGVQLEGGQGVDQERWEAMEKILILHTMSPESSPKCNLWCNQQRLVEVAG